MTETVQATREFCVTHATVHYPDGKTEDIEYVDMDDYGETILVFGYDDDVWTAYCMDGEVGLYPPGRSLEEKTTFSTHNIEKIEPGWTEMLVAVAEVPIDVEQESRWFGLRASEEREVASQDFDVEEWERAEWEAHNT